MRTIFSSLVFLALPLASSPALAESAASLPASAEACDLYGMAEGIQFVLNINCGDDRISQEDAVLQGLSILAVIGLLGRETLYEARPAFADDDGMSAGWLLFYTLNLD